ncbi:XdhC family protein [Niallia sp.]|uniref:XdhC family protein n=1 Tax=Niallia sp. TaxID=2837523 RepID=UPI0028A16876|nr:XdhC family protein [Niallia sp.]
MSSDHYSVIDSVITEKNTGYLATIVKVEGSAYRKEGTMMYISDKGLERGLLSGGCVEQDLLARIHQQEQAEPFLMEYDLRSEDDLSWGQGVGCDGKIYIMVEPITMETRMVFQKLKIDLINGKSVKLVKAFNKFSKHVENTIIDIAEDHVNDLPVNTNFSSEIVLFTQKISPQSKLIIYGAGPDARPVVYFASKAGFHVTLSDWREAYCSKEYIPDANEYVLGSPKEVMEEINPTENDYVITMTHSFMKDQEIVDYFLPKKVKYLGLLGSKKRSERLLAGKTEADWIHYPAGLPIHSESPEEIAISIVAELIKIKNQKNAEARVSL